MWSASAEQQLFYRSVGWLNQVWQNVHLGQGSVSSKLQRNPSKGKHTPLPSLLSAAECLIVAWGKSSHLLFRRSRWTFLPGTNSSPSLILCNISKWTQHFQTQWLHCLLFTTAFLLGGQTPLQSITVTSLQCHPILTVIPEACSSSVLNLVQISKAGITRVTPVSSQEGQYTDLNNSIPIVF